MEIELKSDFDVNVVQQTGSDQMVCWAARVSTIGADSLGSNESEGLINFLIQNRHGTPFEHGSITYRITAPIFVWREFHRHRIGFSYNEESGRYKQLEPVFYVAPTERPLVQEGKPGAYTYIPGSPEQWEREFKRDVDTYKFAYSQYLESLNDGIAKEKARTKLPVSIYSTCYVTANPRSLMSFFSLRTKHNDSKFPSFPQWEINKVADRMAYYMWVYWPITYDSFRRNGSVSP